MRLAITALRAVFPLISNFNGHFTIYSGRKEIARRVVERLVDKVSLNCLHYRANSRGLGGRNRYSIAPRAPVLHTYFIFLAAGFSFFPVEEMAVLRFYRGVICRELVKYGRERICLLDGGTPCAAKILQLFMWCIQTCNDL